MSGWRFWRRRRVPSGPPYIVPPPMPEWVAEQIAQAIRDDLGRQIWGDPPTPLENLERAAQEWREDWAQRDWQTADVIWNELKKKES